MPRTPKTRRESPRKEAPRNPGPESPLPGSELNAGGESTPDRTAARIEWLDPRAITWPDSRITSQYDEEKSAALRQSMAELGQQDAVGVVQLEDGSYEGAAGMNRCQSAIEGGAAQVLCVVRQGTHRDVVKANIATSVNQSRANPLSEVEGIANAHYSEGFDVEELVLITGKSAGWVEDRLLISQASQAVKQCLWDGQIAIGHAALLARVEDQVAQEGALGLQLRHRWSVRELDEHLRGSRDVEGQPAGEGPRTRQRTPRGPMVCNYCAVEHDPSEVQKVVVCKGCADKVGPHATAVREGEVAASVELLKEAESVLAGSQAGASLAERISVLIGPA